MCLFVGIKSIKEFLMKSIIVLGPLNTSLILGGILRKKCAVAGMRTWFCSWVLETTSCHTQVISQHCPSDRHSTISQWNIVESFILICSNFRDIKPDNILLDEEGKHSEWILFEQPSINSYDNFYVDSSTFKRQKHYDSLGSRTYFHTDPS